ncbi:MAG: hypothetical protein M0Q88_09710 [Bacilli bacterium]|nr:hypothetical protein [Bacilli bacterium]
MKKLSLLLAILLIVSFGVSAADANTTLNIATEVADQFGLVIHTGNAPTSLSDFNGLTSAGTAVDPIAFDDTDITNESTRTLTVSAMTNKTSAYKVSVTAEPLSATGQTTPIGYTVSPASSSAIVVDEEKTFDLMTFNATGGLFFSSKDFGITLSASDWENAGAGEYSTQWTVSLVTN